MSDYKLRDNVYVDYNSYCKLCWYPPIQIHNNNEHFWAWIYCSNPKCKNHIGEGVFDSRMASFTSKYEPTSQEWGHSMAGL
jgi:hypothetical protein